MGYPTYDLTLNQYQERAAKYAIYPAVMVGEESCAWVYPALGLCGEAGEVAEKIKKLIRDKGGVLTDDNKKEIAKEVGDVLWYCSNILQDIGISLEACAYTNLAKLESRQARNLIKGEGDNR